jgi:hypothetical protein
MRLSESRAVGGQRSIWIAVFVAALWLSLVNAGTAFAGGEHPPDSGSSGWQHHTEGDSTSWGDTSDEGHPPPETPGAEGPCEEEGHTPPGETPPTETPPVETPPVETPPDHGTPPGETPPTDTPPVETPPDHGTPPVETPPESPPVETPPDHGTPPVETPPVQTPPVQTPPVETPPVQTPPVETPVETPQSPTSPNSPESPTTPVEREGGGDEVLDQEQGGGGGVESPTEVTEAAPAAGTLPFTGSPTPLLALFGVALLGLGVGIRRVTSERG